MDQVRSRQRKIEHLRYVYIILLCIPTCIYNTCNLILHYKLYLLHVIPYILYKEQATVDNAILRRNTLLGTNPNPENTEGVYIFKIQIYIYIYIYKQIFMNNVKKNDTYPSYIHITLSKILYIHKLTLLL